MEDFIKLKVPELKQRCKSLGLAVGGTKPVLIARLQAHHQNASSSAPASESTATSTRPEAASEPASVEITQTPKKRNADDQGGQAVEKKKKKNPESDLKVKT